MTGAVFGDASELTATESILEMSLHEISPYKWPA